MKFPSHRISSKVRNSAISAAIVTVIVGIVSDTPLGESQWGRALKNPATVGGLITIVSTFTGYQTEETALDPEVKSPES